MMHKILLFILVKFHRRSSCNSKNIVYYIYSTGVGLIYRDRGRPYYMDSACEKFALMTQIIIPKILEVLSLFKDFLQTVKCKKNTIYSSLNINFVIVLLYLFFFRVEKRIRLIISKR